MNIMETTAISEEHQARLLALLEHQRQAFLAEGEVLAQTREERLDRCISLLVDHQDTICQALAEDFSGRAKLISLMLEFYPSLTALKYARKHLRRWMKPQRRRAGFPLNLFGSRASIHYQPKGVVGVMAPWNAPLFTIFSPLAEIFAAGNRCLIKPSEYTPALSELLAELSSRYFDDTELAMVTGGPEVGATFSALPFDHLIFTGATHIGRHVMQAAAGQLCPVTLEMGGKSPVLIGESADLEDAAGKIISSKCINAGQLCIAPDYVLLPVASQEAFVDAMRKVMHQRYPQMLDNPDYPSVINQRHYQRVLSYLKDARDRGLRVVEINPAGESFESQQHYKIPLTLILDPPDDALVMKEEIFGPVMGIRTHEGIKQAIDYVNRRPHPLALYYFGKDRQEQEAVIRQAIAGGITINDVAAHVNCSDLPFGGIGDSGMGHYQGLEGFRTFSHAKPVYRQGRLDLAALAGTLPPYTSRAQTMIGRQIKK